jgi:hypothetical protein
MAKIIHVATELKVLKNSRLRHAIVTSVTNQTSVSVSIGKGTPFAVTKGNGTTTIRPKIWS